MGNEQIREQLNQLKTEIHDRVERTHKHIYEKDHAVSAEYSEQSVEMENQQLVYALDAEGKQLLLRIERALLRLDNDHFGECEACGKVIKDARLKAVPYAELCIDCANKE